MKDGALMHIVNSDLNISLKSQWRCAKDCESYVQRSYGNLRQNCGTHQIIMFYKNFNKTG